jgi:hypothetical protein
MKKESVASKTDRELKVALTEHQPELSWAHSTGLWGLRPGIALPGRSGEGVLHRPPDEVRLARQKRTDQFMEPLAPTVAAAVVDPLECCASSDAPTVPDAPDAAVVGAVVLGDLAALADAGAAVADFAGMDFAGIFAADVDSVLFSDFEASAVVATLAVEELAAEDVVFPAELATLLLS